MGSLVKFAQHDGIAVITLDNPPVNALAQTQGLLQDIQDYIAQTKIDAATDAIVLIGANRCFSGGADIKEFGKPRDPNMVDLRELTEFMDTCSKMLIAAIHGPTMGGGLELAMACHYRVATADALLALPEVKLGILPGAGGTQRLPRLIGAETALRMITTGEPINAQKALAAGLVDEMITGDLLQGALAYARRLVAERKRIRRVSDLTVQVPGDAATFLAAAHEQIAKASRGYPAPLKCFECVKAAIEMPFDKGYQRERELFLELIDTTESKALRYAFFAEREANKIPDIPDSTATIAVKKVGVIGAGTMGGGISMNFANAGIPVTIVEAKEEALDRGLATIKKNYANTVAKGRLKQEDMDKRMALLTPSLTLESLKDADMVIEAVFEDMEVKKGVFRELDRIAKPGAILASNTSTLDVNAIAAVTKRPESVIGTHFFSPANVMRLLEIVRGAKTSKEVLGTVMKLSKTIKKVGVVSGVCDGFIGNRMIEEYIRQATFLLEEGALPQQVDGALQKWGMAMGPFAMSDLAGLDIGWAIRKRKSKENPNEVFSKIGDRICELGRFGQKTGAGFYKYEAGDRKPISDPVVEELIVNYSKEMGIARRTVTDEEIIERCIYSLANVGAKILEEGIALRASDIDIVYLTGYGFPPYRGGPMFYADTVGLKNVVATMERFKAGRNGHYWEPALLMRKLAADGKSFTGQKLR